MNLFRFGASTASTLTLSLSLALASAAVPVHAGEVVLPDGGMYQGQLRRGKLHGQGQLRWPNGASYEGAFEQGLYSGKGKYRSAAGETYEGSFKLGMMSGKGRLVATSGTVYVGQFNNNHFDGIGRSTLAGGGVYAGHFSKGQYHGLGRWTSADEHYAGQFSRGKPSGKGVMRYTAGGMFAGEFADGIMHGKGRFEKADGQVYVGQFVRGEFTGKGTFRSVDGGRYAGMFVNWIPHGPGRLVDLKGNSYEGNFEFGEPKGKMRFVGRDGSTYTGAFAYGKYEGPGVLRLRNGDQYTGNFVYGLPDGEGTMRYAKAKEDGRLEDKGKWRRGEFFGAGDKPDAAEQVETALYTQRALLDRALAALQPERAGMIDMYFMAVGGDGTQEVFRRETDFVRTQFDRDFGTEGRSLVLVNSRSTLTQRPLATVSSIAEGVGAIGARMDKQNDILFLFLTSHGSETHQLSLQPAGLEVRQLAAKELGRVLKESAIRWKVVLVSACYAGGFIEHLKDEHTLVITAARSDRTSFGCADENDFTYFGRAYFKESLPQSESFVDAFERAKVLVRQWEAGDGKQQRGARSKVLHSEPQMFLGAQVGKHLDDWRAQLKAAQATAARAPVAK